MWQLYCRDGAAGAEFRQLQSSQGAVRAWAWNTSRMLMRHLATQPQPLALSTDCQPPLLDGHRSLNPMLTSAHLQPGYMRFTNDHVNIFGAKTAARCNSLEMDVGILLSQTVGLVHYSNMKHLMTWLDLPNYQFILHLLKKLKAGKWYNRSRVISRCVLAKTCCSESLCPLKKSNTAF